MVEDTRPLLQASSKLNVYDLKTEFRNVVCIMYIVYKVSSDGLYKDKMTVVTKETFNFEIKEEMYCKENMPKHPETEELLCL